ncbi:MAG: short-chain dehydrogenase [Actinobacteria bacterium HGW-Actinobacteria-9]|nr:MAG: short-chain dehydrogenase [Actinobacteria bacterium HGW-Actinobacteria-9]
MFQGTKVVITGGSSGIGLATAIEFARRGAHVAIVGRDTTKLDSAAEEIRAARSDPETRVLTASADLSQFNQAKSVIDRFASEDMVPDVLVNSAGTILPGVFETMPLEYITHNMENGYFSVVWPCRAVVPYMTARGSGHIVNVSSVAGFLGIYGYTGYSAAKYAVIGFTEALRFEMRPHGVSVHVALPPDTDTPALAYEKTLRPPETDVVAGNIKAIAPGVVARAIVRGVERDTYHIIPDATSRFYFRLKGLLPEVFFSIVDRDIAKARASAGKGL